MYEMYSGPKPALIGSSALTDHTLRVMLTLVSPSTLNGSICSAQSVQTTLLSREANAHRGPLSFRLLPSLQDSNSLQFKL